MKVDNIITKSGPRVAHEKVDFNDKAIDKLFIKTGNRITVKFKNIRVPYLTGLSYDIPLNTKEEVLFKI